jgi:hypothetical protein
LKQLRWLKEESFRINKKRGTRLIRREKVDDLLSIKTEIDRAEKERMEKKKSRLKILIEERKVFMRKVLNIYIRKLEVES